MALVGEVDPLILIETGAATISATFSLATGDSLANGTSVDAEKTALAAWNNAPTRDINSFSAPASVATGQVVEAPAVVSTSSSGNDYLVPGPKGLVSASVSSEEERDPVLEEFCIKAGLRSPKGVRTRLGGIGGDSGIDFSFAGRYRPMPGVCHGLYGRIAQVKFEIENPKNNKQRLKVNGWMPVINDGSPIGDEGGIGEQNGYTPRKYRCTPGKGVTDGYVTGRHTVKYIPDGKVVARNEAFTRKMQPRRPDIKSKKFKPC